MLIQLHKQNIHDPSKTELVAQCDPNQIKFIGIDVKFDLVNKWIADLQTRHSIGEDEQWMLCDEGSPLFVRGMPQSREGTQPDRSGRGGDE